jgi:hypothetical protein
MIDLPHSIALKPLPLKTSFAASVLDEFFGSCRIFHPGGF